MTDLLVSQLIVEVATLRTATPSVQISQEIVEVATLRSAEPSVQVSQLVLEVATIAITVRPRTQMIVIG